jgi:hypothetical protein
MVSLKRVMVSFKLTITLLDEMDRPCSSNNSSHRLLYDMDHIAIKKYYRYRH